jgi:hypothetical protein
VAFIEMANFRTKAQRAQQTPAADAEDAFLAANAFPNCRRIVQR